LSPRTFRLATAFISALGAAMVSWARTARTATENFILTVVFDTKC
jgi:hypothetical protein